MTQVKKSSAEILINDALQNILTGSGIPGIDKKTGASFEDVHIEYAELEAAYSCDWLAGKVCDIPPFDMTRAWRTFNKGFTPDELLRYNDVEKHYQLREKVQEALVYSRIYGGAGMVMNVDDGRKPWEPLNIGAVKKGGLRWLIVSDSQFIKASRFDQDPFSPNYGYPSHYRMAPSSIEIHHSRVIRFEGVPLPLAARRRNQYWGKSIIERLYSALANAAAIQENVGTLVYEASVDVIKVPDLMGKASIDEDEKALSKRFGIAKIQKSVNRMLLLDAEEEFQTHEQSFTGLKDMMQQFLSIAAAAADIPITRLLGQSPGGLSATGDSDIRNYYDAISGQQECRLRPKLDRVDAVMYRSVFGRPPEEGNPTGYVFNTLWQLNEQEKSTVELNKANRDVAYIDRGVITDGIAAAELMASGTYAGIDVDYIDSLDDGLDEGGDDDDEGGEHDEGEGEHEGQRGG